MPQLRRRIHQGDEAVAQVVDQEGDRLLAAQAAPVQHRQEGGVAAPGRGPVRGGGEEGAELAGGKAAARRGCSRGVMHARVDGRQAD
jgi:hypothetical protein